MRKKKHSPERLSAASILPGKEEGVPKPESMPQGDFEVSAKYFLGELQYDSAFHTLPENEQREIAGYITAEAAKHAVVEKRLGQRIQEMLTTAKDIFSMKAFLVIGKVATALGIVGASMFPREAKTLAISVPGVHEMYERLSFNEHERALADSIRTELGDTVGDIAISYIATLESVQTSEERERILTQIGKEQPEIPVIGAENTETFRLLNILIYETLPRGFAYNINRIVCQKEFIYPMEGGIYSSERRDAWANIFENTLIVGGGKSLIEPDFYLLNHEGFHLQDWNSNHLLTLKERMRILLTMLQESGRALQDDPNFYPGINQNTPEALRKYFYAMELFASLGDGYLGDPRRMNLKLCTPERLQCIIDFIRLIDPSFDVMKALEQKQRIEDGYSQYYRKEMQRKNEDFFQKLSAKGSLIVQTYLDCCQEDTTSIFDLSSKPESWFLDQIREKKEYFILQINEIEHGPLSLTYYELELERTRRKIKEDTESFDTVPVWTNGMTLREYWRKTHNQPIEESMWFKTTQNSYDFSYRAVTNMRAKLDLYRERIKKIEMCEKHVLNDQ